MHKKKKIDSGFPLIGKWFSYESLDIPLILVSQRGEVSSYCENLLQVVICRSYCFSVFQFHTP